MTIQETNRGNMHYAVRNTRLTFVVLCSFLSISERAFLPSEQVKGDLFFFQIIFTCIDGVSLFFLIIARLYADVPEKSVFLTKIPLFTDAILKTCFFLLPYRLLYDFENIIPLFSFLFPQFFPNLILMRIFKNRLETLKPESDSLKIVRFIYLPFQIVFYAILCNVFATGKIYALLILALLDSFTVYFPSNWYIYRIRQLLSLAWTIVLLVILVQYEVLDTFTTMYLNTLFSSFRMGLLVQDYIADYSPTLL
jgi:hypothetical protein